MPNEIQITDANFDQEVTRSAVPVLVDFWAPWCGPCRMIGPVIEELAAEYAGKVKVGKLNTDENPETASRFQISAIPTILFFKGGRMVKDAVGLQPKEELKKIMDSLL
ncbi:MAG: thioredoxin 1 [Elusimicrobia bacterium]|nr:MAG: thioredoxin 1 [Elusimicrobiota bacterium]KAF0154421.1 MAG: thioredoxin 1 [Elusimicrobiota bacterium]